jgi:hypothetical protein
MHEILSPTRLDTRQIFEREFIGMTDRLVTYEELDFVREKLISEIVKGLSLTEKQFLVSIKQGTPKWALLGIPGIENLPALKWKLANIGNMDRARHERMLNNLRAILEL